MAHPRIEAAAEEIERVSYEASVTEMAAELRRRKAKAAARVILAAEPSEAEVEAAFHVLYPRTKFFSKHIRTKIVQAIKSANAAKAKEIGL